MQYNLVSGRAAKIHVIENTLVAGNACVLLHATKRLLLFGYEEKLYLDCVALVCLQYVI
jgi:hypothetical protein